MCDWLNAEEYWELLIIDRHNKKLNIRIFYFLSNLNISFYIFSFWCWVKNFTTFNCWFLQTQKHPCHFLLVHLKIDLKSQVLMMKFTASLYSTMSRHTYQPIFVLACHDLGVSPLLAVYLAFGKKRWIIVMTISWRSCWIHSHWEENR